MTFLIEKDHGLVTESMRKRSGYREYRRAVLDSFKIGRRFLRLSGTRRFQQRILCTSGHVLSRLLLGFALVQGKAIPRQNIMEHFEQSQSRTVARRLAELRQRRLVSVVPVKKESGRWGQPYTAPDPGSPGVCYVSRIDKTDDLVLNDAIDAPTAAVRCIDEKKLLTDPKIKSEFTSVLSGCLNLLEPDNIEFIRSLAQGVPEIAELLSLPGTIGGSSIPRAYVIPEEIVDITLANLRCLDSQERLPIEELRRLSFLASPLRA